MTPATYRGVVRGGTIQLDPATPLPEGTEVVVTPATAPASSGDPAALLMALNAAPPVPAEWMDELEMLIEQGRRPPTIVNPFAKQTGGA
jgi:hypothetical protein